MKKAKWAIVAIMMATGFSMFSGCTVTTPDPEEIEPIEEVLFKGSNTNTPVDGGDTDRGGDEEDGGS